MAEPFKLLFDAAVVEAMGRHLQRVAPTFDRRSFEARALAGLDALALKARAMQLADALEATLPAEFGRAADWLEAALAPVAASGPDVDAADAAEVAEVDLAALRSSDAGLAGWAVWPMTEFIARRGLAEPQRALAALHAMTQRFSAEWAIRTFIEQHPALTFETLARWCHDPSPHVRRLVSEGSRPRLPWGQRLKGLVADPAPTLPLLAALQDDPSAYVRRSVANHLNDIAKDHPVLLADWLERHLPGASPARRVLLRHACRTLIKQGDARVLAAWGQGAALLGVARLHLAPARLRLGEALTLTVELDSSARQAQALVVDYVVHHVKANGSTSPKVFKGWNVTMAPLELRQLIKRHALRRITTRSYYPGMHRVELQVNGRVLAEETFELEQDDA
jgi:3-methyladenine DNA glycosylase AlkC